MKNDTNLYIYYLTDKCNFRCTYCYEEQDKVRKSSRVTREDVISFIDKTITESKDQNQVLYVLFGGEPFLEFELMKFFTEYATQKRFEICGNKNVRFTTFTNGSFFWNNNNILKFLRLDAVKRKMFTVMLSYDGVGNYKRLDSRGKDTTPKTISLINKLSKMYENGIIDLCISYTVCKDNYNKLQMDLEYILSSFKVNRIILQFNTQELGDEFGICNNDDPKQCVKNFVLTFNPDIPKLYNKYLVPICEYTCEDCRRCNKGHSEYIYGFKKEVRNLDANSSHNKTQILI